MASPLPNTNAPASAKYQAIFHKVASTAGPAKPVIDHAGSGMSSSAASAAPRLGAALINSATTPLATNNHMTSDSVQAVTTALVANSTHNRGSRASVSFVSLCTLRAMIAITAAP